MIRDDTQAQLLREVVSEAREQYHNCFGRAPLRATTPMAQGDEPPPINSSESSGQGVQSLISQWHQAESDRLDRIRGAKRRRAIIERQRQKRKAPAARQYVRPHQSGAMVRISPQCCVRLSLEDLAEHRELRRKVQADGMSVGAVPFPGRNFHDVPSDLSYPEQVQQLERTQMIKVQRSRSTQPILTRTKPRGIRNPGQIPVRQSLPLPPVTRKPRVPRRSYKMNVKRVKIPFRSNYLDDETEDDEPDTLCTSDWAMRATMML